jgi:hypothetical protein
MNDKVVLTKGETDVLNEFCWYIGLYIDLPDNKIDIFRVLLGSRCTLCFVHLGSKMLKFSFYKSSQRVVVVAMLLRPLSVGWAGQRPPLLSIHPPSCFLHCTDMLGSSQHKDHTKYT